MMPDVNAELADELLRRWYDLETADRFYIIGRLSNSDSFDELLEQIAKGLNRA